MNQPEEALSAGLEDRQEEQGNQETQETQEEKSEWTDGPFTYRRISTSSGDHTFKFLVLDSPDKWRAADDFPHVIYEMPLLGSQKRLGFKVYPVSAEKWMEIETKYRLPMGDNVDDTEMQKAFLRKQIAILEAAARSSIPGENLDEKFAFLQKRNGGEVDALFAYIRNHVCDIDTDSEGPLLSRYNLLSSGNEGELIDINGFEDWSVAEDTTYFFRWQRNFEDFIIEVPLRSISRECNERIEEATKEPEPPKTFARDPVTKKFDHTRQVGNYNDPSFLMKMRKLQQKRTAMYLSEALPFDVPGSNIDEKYEWIAKRIIGDVLRLKKFVEGDVVGYASRYFFT